MNNDILAGNWHKIKGEVKRQWGRLTDDQLTQIEGNSEKLAGYVQEAYGVARDEAERQVADWQKTFKDKSDAA